MSYSVSYIKEEGYVAVEVSGEPLPSEHANARGEAMRLCAEMQCSRLLVDLRSLRSIHSTTLSCFSFGVALAHDLAGVFIAHVLPVDPKSQEDVKFTATVAANRGAVTREFEDINEAKQWLRELSPPDK